MQRRSFLKGTAILSTAILVSPSFALTQEEENPFGITNKPRKFSITNKYVINPSEESAQVWIPLPKEETYHKVIDLKFSGNYEEAKIVTNDYDTKVLYAKWNKGEKNRELELTFDVIMQQRVTNFSKATSKTDYPSDVAVYLKGTKHIPVNASLQKIAQEIVQKANTPLEKAQAIFDWTVTTMYRDNSVIGCGIGDASKTLEEKIYGGKCTDISSAFVALLRNVGIPSREVFGIRAGQSKISNACGKADEKGFANITGGQHCRAEFYVDGLGWVPADPADVTKVRLAEKLTNEDKKIQDLKKYFFGSWEMNWVAFNSARDFVLNPKPTQYPLNMLGYPYAEVGEDALDYYNPKAFSYTYTSVERV